VPDAADAMSNSIRKLTRVAGMWRPTEQAMKVGLQDQLAQEA
jgi:hypothetical protein